MVDLTGTLVLLGIPVLAAAMILLEDRRIASERKES
jgi:hypothetical protein